MGYVFFEDVFRTALHLVAFCLNFTLNTEYKICMYTRTHIPSKTHLKLVNNCLYYIINIL